MQCAHSAPACATPPPLTCMTFDQLEDDAKERARDCYRDGALDYDWWDAIYADVSRIGPILGYEIKTHLIKVFGGPHYHCASIWFERLFCQGRNVTMDAHWNAKSDPDKIISGILAHAPIDGTLHDIALDLAELAERAATHDVSVDVISDGEPVVWITEPQATYDWGFVKRAAYEACFSADRMDQFEVDFCNAHHRFTNWILERLEDESLHLTSDESIDEMILANEYEFHPDGSRAD